MKILLIGPPASGKGTVGEALSEKLGIPLVSIGQVLRDIPEDSPHFKSIDDCMDKGQLAPNDLVADILEEYLNKNTKGDYVLDGWARQVSDIEEFDPNPDIVLFIKIADETAVKRISGRRVCGTDGTVCNVFTVDKDSPESCEKCEGPLTQRDDDTEEVVRERLKVYHEKTVPMIEKYREAGKLVEIDGEGTPEEVIGLVLEALSSEKSI